MPMVRRFDAADVSSVPMLPVAPQVLQVVSLALLCAHAVPASFRRRHCSSAGAAQARLGLWVLLQLDSAARPMVVVLSQLSDGQS